MPYLVSLEVKGNVDTELHTHGKVPCEHGGKAKECPGLPAAATTVTKRQERILS